MNIEHRQPASAELGSERENSAENDEYIRVLLKAALQAPRGTYASVGASTEMNPRQLGKLIGQKPESVVGALKRLLKTPDLNIEHNIKLDRLKKILEKFRRVPVESETQNKKARGGKYEIKRQAMERAILSLLSETDFINAQVIAKQLEMTPQTAKKHILNLEDAGLVEIQEVTNRFQNPGIEIRAVKKEDNETTDR